MLDFEDFHGGDLIDLEAVRSAKTNAELRKAIQSHVNFLEDQLLDALGHLQQFEKELKFP